MIGEPVCLYVRVSTLEQAKHDLSIPDQLNQLRAFAEKRGSVVTAEFVEPGATGRNDHRPQFQEMLARALVKPPEFTRIIVHSLSRFFRDAIEHEVYKRKLEKNGVQIVSVTQDFGEGTGSEIARRIVTLMDEFSSVETSKHVRRTMMENARQNFWNGSVAPLGYRTVVAELRGSKEKKRLEIDPVTSETIRLIYRLYLEGDGKSGPLGIKNTVKYLNERGFRTPNGNKFHISYIEKILKHEVYVGRAWYNRVDSQTRTERPKEEWIAVQVPPIISEEDFQRVQVQLHDRDRKTTPPRLVNSPVLLSGVAVCGGCGGPMLLQTGKSGKYRYYRCSLRFREGVCPGGAPEAISADSLDNIVLGRLCDGLLTAARVQSIVAEVTALREAGSDQAAVTLGQLRAQRVQATKKLSNLMNALANGIEATESFNATVKSHEIDRDRITALIAAQERILAVRMKEITLEEAEDLASKMRHMLADSEPALKKRIIRSFVSRVVVSADEIVITGAKPNLAEIITGSL